MTQPDPDTFSPRTMRIMLVTIAAAMISCAFFVNSIFSWLWWLQIAVAVIALCAAITPPFRKT
jgi:tRNA threonylcarbamoyladenosine modification (KEOPS) complex  Pcc1 subunit